jgi:hypothetical protein
MTDSGQEASWNLNSLPANNFTRLYQIPLDNGLQLKITRFLRKVLTETYTFENTLTEKIAITALRIQTPFNNLYDSALWSLTTA